MGLLLTTYRVLTEGKASDVVDLLLALADSDEGLNATTRTLLLMGKVIEKTALSLLLKTVSTIKDFGTNIISLAQYVLETSDPKQDLYTSVWVPASPTEPPPALPCDRCTDSAAFMTDATLADGSAVSPGQSLLKTWRVKNTGTSTWDGYKLIFLQGDQMGGNSPVSIPRTSPGQQVDISVDLRAPDSPGAKAGYWQIISRDGGHVPGGRLWVKVNVVTQTSNDHIASFTADPASPASASSVRFRARVNWWAQYRAMRVLVDNQVIGEASDTDHAFEWNTSSVNRGEHSIVLEVADQSDTSWSHPERRFMTYTLQGTPQPANHAPNRPSPTNANGGANDWTVYYSGNTGYLCVQANGDPDGDSITGYYFDIYESAQLWNSGWTGSSCVTTAGLGPYTYKWRVKVRDSGGAESEWSDAWYFTLVDPNVTITECYLEPRDSTGEQFRVHACTSGQGGVNVTLRISANEAADGSSNGKWNQFFELGVPCFTSENYPTWFTLPYADGTHRLRCEARGNTLSWTGAAVRDITYTLPHRRPNGAGLVAPVASSGNSNGPVYLNSRSVNFKWLEAIRANSYTLHVSTTTSPDTDPNPVYRQTLPSGTTSHNVNFDQDYPTLYWTVTTSNDVSSSTSNVQRIGIDRAVPTCQVQALPSATPDGIFRVDWSGSDSLAGIRTFDVQYLDSGRGDWSDWIGGALSTKTYQLFVGQPGHTYSFRCRASDNADNQGTYPDTADTSVRVDPTVRPPTPWWNAEYAQKRNLLIINQDDDYLPGHYPIKMHFDSTTTPTAQEIYDASLSSTKGNDVRVVYNDATELNRTVQRFTATQIDLWFPLQASLGGGGSLNGAYQLYYGNAAAGSPPADPNAVFLPATDSNTMGLWHFQEGSGSTVADGSGRNHLGSFASSSWADGWLGWTGNFNGASGYVNAGNSADFNLAGGPMTIEAWINLRSPVGENIVSKRANSDESYWLKLNPDRQLWWSICCSGDSSVTNWGYPSLELGKWYHIAASFDGASTMSVFVNGQKQRTITTARPGRNSSQNLQIGWARDTTSWFNGYIQHVRVSNIERTDFPYARITTAPIVASGDVIFPPNSALPDLVLQSLTTYPVDGQTFEQGVIVQAIVKNEGNASTVNGFYTDFYADHLPLGPGDYSGSVRFLVNEPIAAGATVTLTTVLPDLPGSAGAQTAAAMSPMQEVTSTIYVQTDSTGVVKEITKGNNISTTGASTCIAAADVYEDDDVSTAATLLVLDSPQRHNFHALGDDDWLEFQASAATTYAIQTSELTANADTYLYLYDTDGTTLLVSNDDFGGALASSLEWTAPTTGTYFVRVRHWNPSVGGCGTAYTVSITKPLFCFVLSHTHTGSGSDPITSPANSNGCPADQYVAGASISLTASPASGWRVGSWSGTSNNSSTSTTNSVTMPASSHTVTVNYEQINNPPYKPANPSPAHDAVDIPLPFTLRWTGGDPDTGDTVTYDVYFGVQPNLVVAKLCSDTSLTTCGPAGGSGPGFDAYWRVIAKDSRGASTTGDIWHFRTTASGDTSLPTASWVSPTNGQTITERTVRLQADASDASGIKEVRFSAKYDGAWHGLATVTSSPYLFDWDMCSANVPDGDIELGLEATDNADNKYVYSSDHTNYHITKRYNCNPDTTPPAGRITSPSNNTTITTCPLQIVAEASDTGSGVAWVRFWADYDSQGHEITTDTSGGDGWTATWDCAQVSNQQIRLTTWMADRAGNQIRDPGGYVSVNLNKNGSSDAQVRAFVRRFYQQCLNREPDQGGWDNWTSALISGSLSGADLAQAFIFSDEFIRRNTSNAEFLTIMYRAFFNREPDAGGYNSWMALLNGGMSRADVLYGFTHSQEFANLCAAYGIRPYMSQRERVEAFVARFYQQCLARQPDAPGLAAWTDSLLRGAQTGADVARGFIFSTEFINRNTSNAQFLTIMYRAFFAREPDSGGYNAWLNALNGGTSRADVLNGFTHSTEFANLCRLYGIRPF
jgi:hypothetical protein